MNYKIRLLQDSIIDVVNKFDDVPLEAKRLVLESIMHIVEKAADKAIFVESDVTMEDKNAEGIFEDKLGELSK